MNTIIRNNKELIIICNWVDNNDKSRDSKGKLFPIPKQGKEWGYKDQFINRLKYVELILKNNNKIIKMDEKKSCLLCDKEYAKYTYKFGKYIWQDILIHYIDKHNIKPPEEFMDFVYFNKLSLPINLTTNITLKRPEAENKDNKKYIKINKNQLLILDALLEHGGYTKKYSDSENTSIYRYSEHSGLFNLNRLQLQKIVVLANTDRVDLGDDEIYMPQNVNDMNKYEYMYHTHPPTPKAGGRAELGIVYELPSIGDVLHFIEHFNEGKISGSIVISSEGLYNIRKLDFTKNKFDIDEDNLYREFIEESRKIQKKCINKYGYEFTKIEFYSKIAQDTNLINSINEVTNKYNINIDYIPRIKDKNNNWILDTIYLPVYK
jgi:hypothetical protein